MKLEDIMYKIMNGEEVPKKIKYEGHVWYYNDFLKDYEYNEITKYNSSIGNYEYKTYSLLRLNNEVEILEEKKKIPEKLKDIIKDGYCIEAPDNFDLMNKINEIIDYLKSKGE